MAHAADLNSATRKGDVGSTPTLGTPVDRLVLDLTAFAKRAPHTVYQYKLISKDFLRNAVIPPTRDDVLHFIAQKNAQATKEQAFFILKRLFVANEWPWPFPARSAPRVHGQKQVQLPPEIIQALVQGAGTDQQRFYLALSTVYGFRLTEMAHMTKVNFKKGEVITQSAKGGDLRRHRIPKEIAAQLRHAPSTPLSDSRVSYLLHEAARAAGVELPESAGWHAIRRSLISHLSVVCPETAIVRFIGWKSGKGPRIMYTYAHPEAENVDEIVFAHHPFLKFWA